MPYMIRRPARAPNAAGVCEATAIRHACPKIAMPMLAATKSNRRRESRRRREEEERDIYIGHRWCYLNGRAASAAMPRSAA